MFQRPGTKLFTETEIQPEIDRLYGHLSEAQRKSLAKRLVAPDHGGPDDQQGQKMDRVTPYRLQVKEPASLEEAKSLFGKDWKQQNFEAKSMTTQQTPGPDGAKLDFTFTGTLHPKDGDPTDGSSTSSTTIPDDSKIIAKGRAGMNNPDRYEWSVERQHDKSGITTLTAVGKRVKAYLHHGSIDASPHDRFAQPESNADFYATSTFKPPPPPPPPAASGATMP
jgi:hypothetical protein